MNPKVSIIIPSFKPNNLLYNCIESLIKNTQYDNYEFLVISTKGSFAENCNKGIKATDGEYVLLLNDDTQIVDPIWLKTLVYSMEANPEAAAISPKMVFPNGAIQFGGMIFHEDGFGGHLHFGFAPFFSHLVNELTEFQATTFGCVLLRRKAIEDVGLIDEIYKIGAYEDIDWCFKAKLKGWKILYQPKSVLMHHESQTFKNMDQNQRNSTSSENRKIFYDRWYKYFKDGTFISDDIKYIGGKI